MMTVKIATIENDDSFTGLCLCGFHTDGWPTREIAAARIGQHKVEHETGRPMESLSAFRDRFGLIALGKLAVFPDGAEEVIEEGADEEE